MPPLLVDYIKLISALLVGLMASALFLPSRADADEAYERRALIYARALAYDRNLDARAGTQVDIGVLYKAGSADSESDRKKMVEALEKAASVKISGLDVSISSHPYESKDALIRSATENDLDAIYICEGLEAELSEILNVTRDEDLTSLSAQEESVNQGVSIGVIVIENKPKLLVNLPSSKEEGMKLASDLLKVAEVIK